MSPSHGMRVVVTTKIKDRLNPLGGLGGFRRFFFSIRWARILTACRYEGSQKDEGNNFFHWSGLISNKNIILSLQNKTLKVLK
jgi:hypothetical protein